MRRLSLLKPWYIKIDLKNAFYNILIHSKSRYLTTFEYRGFYYNFKYLPFGLSISPFFMQMIANYIADEFRKFGIYSWIHVDDLIGGHCDKYLLTFITEYITFKLMKCGIRINNEKSQLIPTPQIEFLGSLWTQTNVRRLKTVSKTMQLILHQILHTVEAPNLKRAQQIAGFLNYYLCFAGRIYLLITFYLHNYKFFEPYKEWWVRQVQSLMQFDSIRCNAFLKPSFATKEVNIYADASSTHIGLYNKQTDQGSTIKALPGANIYVNELYATFLALVNVRNNYKPDDETVFNIYTDNSIVYYLFNRSRARLKYANMQQVNNIYIFFLILSKLYILNIFYVNTKMNPADVFSRPGD